MYTLTPYSQKVEPFAYWENAFNNDELNWLQYKASEAKEQARVGVDYNENAFKAEVRRSEINWLQYTNETHWVYERLAHVVSSLNSQFFFFDLTGFGEHFQLTNYHEKYAGKYGWHVDIGNSPITPCRKLSLVLQLSDPVEYDGGILEIKPFTDEVIKLKKQRGTIVCFPSFCLHQVTPVTRGCRQSLVSWITGPSFK